MNEWNKRNNGKYVEEVLFGLIRDEVTWSEVSDWLMLLPSEHDGDESSEFAQQINDWWFFILVRNEPEWTTIKLIKLSS